MASRILIVEDNEDIAEALEHMLSLAGHEVVRTGNGLTGVLLGARQHWDLVLLDLNLEELPGTAVGPVLRDLGDTAIVVISAKAGPWKRAAIEAGATACLSKPFDLDQLAAMVESILTGRMRPPAPVGDVRHLSREDLDRIARMSPEELDALPFGVIQVNGEGIVTVYNAYEAAAARRDPATVVGRRLVEIAPCLSIREFLSNVEAAGTGAHVDEVMRFVFPHHGGRCVVSVRVFSEGTPERTWIFVSKRSPPG